MGILAKTDKLDSKIMAYFAAKIEPTPHPPPDEASQKLENFLARRNQISDMLTAEKNRLKQSPVNSGRKCPTFRGVNVSPQH
jgi:transposase